MGQEYDNEARRAHALAVAAALAVLGVSVGVNVQELLAAEPPDQLQSGQAKIGFEGIKGNSTQFKDSSMQQKLDATQLKLPSRQHKDRAMPGVKPGAPLRP